MFTLGTGKRRIPVRCAGFGFAHTLNDAGAGLQKDVREEARRPSETTGNASARKREVEMVQ